MTNDQATSEANRTGSAPAPHDVFISYCTEDRAKAEAVCAALESGGTRCWIAPRDIQPGVTWAGEIVDAIAETRLMVLMFSRHVNESEQVIREVERAVARGVQVVPVLLENVAMSGAMEYFLGSRQWLDATAEPFETHLGPLARAIGTILLDEAAEPDDALDDDDDDNASSRPTKRKLVGTGGVKPGLPPYVGPQPFPPGRSDLFFGRRRETRELLKAIHANRVVLVYAPSGAGKSSLINTAVRDRLVRQGFEVLGARVVGALPRSIKAEQVRNVFTFAALCGLDASATPEAYAGYASLKLSDYLGSRVRPPDSPGRVLLFDQVEELFTQHPERFDDRASFFDDLSEALTADDGLRVVLAMRQEYLAEMEALGSRVPGGIFKFRIERLRAESALEAVTAPAETQGVTFADGLAAEIVRQLGIIKARQFDGTLVETRGEFVEPVHLQIVCERLWRGLPAGLTRVERQHLEGTAAVGGKAFADFVVNALDRFYESVVADVAGSDEARENGGYSKELIQLGCMKFVTPSVTRAMVQREPTRVGRLPLWVVEMLEARHLLRAEDRGGEKWYELAHDRLTEPVARRSDPKVTELLFAADLLSTVLERVLEERGGFLSGYFELHPEMLRECEPFAGQPGLFADEAELILRASIAAGEQMQPWAGRVGKDYPQVLLAVVREALANPSTTVRSNAAALVGGGAAPELQAELVTLALTDPDPGVRGAAGDGVAALDVPDLYDRLARALDTPGTRARAVDAMTRISRQSQTNAAVAPRFAERMRRVDGRSRRQIAREVRRTRLAGGLSTLLYVAIPAAVGSAAFTAGVKWLPAALNGSLAQYDPGVGIGVFHGITAGVLWGGCIALALSLYLLVYHRAGEEHTLTGAVKAMLAGLLGGVVSGGAVTLVVAAVFTPESLYKVGWVSPGVARFSRAFWAELFVRHRLGWAYLIAGAAIGVSVVFSAIAVRASRPWAGFIRSQRSLGSLAEVRAALRGTLRIALRYSWPIPVCLVIAAAAELAVIAPAEGAFGIRGKFEGQLLGVAGDTFSQVFGAYGALVGMLFGYVVMSVGVRIPPRNV